MHIAEVVTIAKSLPLLRLNTYKSLILSYSADYKEFSGKILPNGVEIFSKTEGSTFYFQSPLPYLCTCTITVDAKRKDLVEERKSERQMKIETSRKFWTARLSHTHFWEMDTITVLQVFLGKWKSHTRMAQPSEKFRWKKSMACPCFLHRVFSKAVQPSMKVVVGVYINDFFLAVEYANKIVRQIKEWCFFWSVSLQPTKRNTFPHAVLLRHERVACHCFMSFGLCDKKWNCELWL